MMYRNRQVVMHRKKEHVGEDAATEQERRDPSYGGRWMVVGYRPDGGDVALAGRDTKEKAEEAAGLFRAQLEGYDRIAVEEVTGKCGPEKKDRPASSLCLHCKVRKHGPRQRGLCSPCYRRPQVRKLYPLLVRKEP